ncbi:MAG: amidohydrolase family protein [Betaproteobacteria bacterium]
MKNMSRGWLSEKEAEQIDVIEQSEFRSPVPTQIVSNGEYNPLPQTENQRKVEALIKEFADKYGKKQGMDRRTFLRSASGMAAAFLAMNQVFGPIWDVSEAEAADNDAATNRAKGLAKQFIFDDQTHFVRDDFDKEGLLGLGKYASEHWNPKMLDKVPLVLQRYKFENYLKEIFLDSDTKVALLSGAPFDDPSWWLLSNDQIAEARGAINKVAGSRRLFSHFVFTPGSDGWIDDIDRAAAELKPDGWKGYTVGDPLSPSTKKTMWRLDDEKLMYPVYEKFAKSGTQNVCIHKGLLPLDYEQSWAGVWQYATVDDVGKAAKDWPQLNFIIYHTALRPFLEDPATELSLFEKEGYIRWSTDVCRIPKKFNVKNVYAEIGTSFANAAVANPRFSAAFIGQLVNEMGADHVLWGTDSVWYGSPQWQIEAMRRLEIPDDMMHKMGWKTKLGGPDSDVKRQIFGQNAARLYKYKIQAEYENLSNDKLALMKAEYDKEQVARNNSFYGFVGKPA